jgi:serine/threonine-protein kinase
MKRDSDARAGSARGHVRNRDIRDLVKTPTQRNMPAAQPRDDERDTERDMPAVNPGEKRNAPPLAGGTKRNMPAVEVPDTRRDKDAVQPRDTRRDMPAVEPDTKRNMPAVAVPDPKRIKTVVEAPEPKRNAAAAQPRATRRNMPAVQPAPTPQTPAAVAPAQKDKLPPWEGPPGGTVIDNAYRVVGPLGQGGMGMVVLALDERLQREVAIKLIRPAYVANQKARDRFLIEARAMARVRHENVVEIFAFGEIKGSPYFVMEYIPGSNLANWLDDLIVEEKLPAIDEALGYLDQMCRGLAAIHTSGAVHGDLKPSNILLGPASRVAIADLGLSRLFDTSGRIGEHPMAGTPAYLAPEFSRSDLPPHLHQRSDIYALGVIAYEMLTGEPPYDIITTHDMLKAHREPPPLPSRVRPELGTAFDHALLGALSIDPVNRTASADDLRKQLLRARESISASGQTTEVRILVADDDRNFRELARETLAFGFPGARIETVKDGEAALAAIDREPAALCVIDLDMPGMNGVELTAALRANHSVPIVVCTASGGAPDWRLLSSLGADGFLVKPIDPYALIALARKMLQKR